MKKNSLLSKIILVIIYSSLCFIIYNKNTTINYKKESNISSPIIESNKLKITPTSIKEKEITKEKEHFILEVQKIKLNKKVYNIGSKLNTVEKNIELLKESNPPDKENSKIILAAHSGSGYNAYFNDIDKLTKNDEISLIYNNTKYTYIIKDIWEEEKNGYIHIREIKENYILLTTCSKNKGKQLNIIATKKL